MEDGAKKRWSEQVTDAYIHGDEARMRTLCSSYEITLDENGPLKVEINAEPHHMLSSHAETVQFEVVKA